MHLSNEETARVVSGRFSKLDSMADAMQPQDTPPPAVAQHKLRPYQDDLIERIERALQGHRAVLAVAPTGSGKTVLACEAIRRNRASGKPSVGASP